jgi:hypothetical protein
MSLLSRVRSVLASLFGGADEAPSSDPDPTGTAATADAGDAADAHGTAADSAAYRCTVCGTAVEDAVGPCPLCRSSEIVPADEFGSPAADDATGLDAEGATVTRTRDDVDPATRLDEVRRRGAGDGDEAGTVEE